MVADGRRRRYDKTLPFLPTSGTLLDVGCNDGEMVGLMMKRGLRVHGLDHRRHFKGDRPDWFIEGNAHKLPYSDEAFDYVTAFQILEHVPFPAQVVAELARVAKKKVFVTVPVDRKQLDPGHRHFFDARALGILFPGAKIQRLPDCEGRWYFVAWTPWRTSCGTQSSQV